MIPGSPLPSGEHAGQDLKQVFSHVYRTWSEMKIKERKRIAITFVKVVHNGADLASSPRKGRPVLNSMRIRAFFVCESRESS